MSSLGVSGFQFFALTNALLESHLAIIHVGGIVLIITKLFSLCSFFPTGSFSLLQRRDPSGRWGIVLEGPMNKGIKAIFRIKNLLIYFDPVNDASFETLKIFRDVVLKSDIS